MIFTLKEYLERHGLTPYALCRHGDISTATVYPIVRGTAKGIQLETLERIVATLEQMTGERVTACDLIARQEREGEGDLLDLE